MLQQTEKYKIEILQKEKMIADLKDQNRNMREKTDLKDEIKKQTLDKDIKINSLEILIENVQAELQ